MVNSGLAKRIPATWPGGIYLESPAYYKAINIMNFEYNFFTMFNSFLSLNIMNFRVCWQITMDARVCCL